jgi:2-(1,2-epoxy-1,2-dihydrophenyl)acetyl-CoA isomerase
MTEPTFDTILLTVEGPIARLTLNRPDRMNGMTNRMVRETADALEIVAADATVRVLVLTGSGRSFCPGADLQAVASGTVADERLGPAQFRAPVLLHEMPAVTVAVINGACAGAGLGWAAACDLRVATRRAKFNTAFLDVAVAGDMALPWSLPRLLGASKARELCMMPDKFDADEARRIGFVARVFDDEQFADEAEHVAQRLAGAAPAALRTMKANFLDAERMDLASFVEVESERHLALFTLADTREAFAAKVEGRTPHYTGH